MMVGNAGLVQQGYKSYSEQELNNISNGLRFTPLLCMGLALLGLYLQSPTLHFVIAALGILPFWFPTGHPIDIFYNKVVRHAFGGVELPANPLPRRIACLMGGLMNVGIAVSFLYGSTMWAYIFGGVLIVLQLVVIFSHFCVASWLYECTLNIVGNPSKYTSLIDAKELLSKGALLVDVRSPKEFKSGHIPNAINIPAENIASDKRLLGGPVVLYCKSGMRSAGVLKKLNAKGNTEVYNLGGISKWK